MKWFSRKKRDPFVSTAELVLSLMSAEQFEKLFKSCPDRREFMGVVSKASRITESTLLANLAPLGGFTFAENPPALISLPPTLTVEELEQAGATISQSNGETTIYCVDPIMVRVLLIEKKKLAQPRSIILSPWSNIQVVLADAKPEKTQVKSSINENSLLGEKALALMIEEAKSHGAHSLTLTLSSQTIRYSFVTNQNKKASGTVAPLALLGLMLFLENHGGVITVAGESFPLSVSQDNSTTEMTVILRSEGREETTPEAQLPSHWVAAAEETSGEILLVDDNQMFGKVLERFLGKAGFRTKHVTDGEAALNYLKSNSALPLVVVCDLHMPKKDGAQFLTEVRNDRRLANLPCIMLTPDQDVETEIKLISLGADAFISKREDPRLLSAQVQNLVRRMQRMAIKVAA